MRNEGLGDGRPYGKDPPPTLPPLSKPHCSTFMFDAEGMPCAGFDAEAYLQGPLTAFVAGDLTTPSGSTGPSLVYLGAEGKVVAYHGLPEQVGDLRAFFGDDARV